MAYEDGGHCGHEIGQELWKWGKLEGGCRAYWNAMIVEVTSGSTLAIAGKRVEIAVYPWSDGSFLHVFSEVYHTMIFSRFR